MVLAIMDERKTQTRRIIKPQPISGKSYSEDGTLRDWVEGLPRCPYGQPGDRLWVREAWRPAYDAELFCCVEYRVDGLRRKPDAVTLTDDQGHRFADSCPDDPQLHMLWHPSIHMPRWASRLTLEVTAVRVERVQDISEADAQAEGVHPIVRPGLHGTEERYYYDAYRQLWDTINAKRGYGWEVNPWVWVVEFRRVSP
jgi:hypothetical protein